MAAVIGLVLITVAVSMISGTSAHEVIPPVKPDGARLWYYWTWDSEQHTLIKQPYDSAAPSLFTDRNVAARDRATKTHGSRAGQDKLVHSLIGTTYPNNATSAAPFFVDLAANHYRSFSNTYLLEKQHGWRGVCIEPNPSYTAGLVMHRRCQVVRNVITASDGETVEFKMTNGHGGIVGSDFDNKNGGRSSVQIVGVNLNTLLDIFEAPKVIAYLSLDVEGAETYIIQNFNFKKHLFLIITVERPGKKFHEIAVNNGYWWANRLEITGEMLYLHESTPNFHTYMAEHRGSRQHPPDHSWVQSTRGVPQPHEYLLTPSWPVTVAA